MTTYFWKDQNKIVCVDEEYAQEFLYTDYFDDWGMGYGAIFSYGGDINKIPILRSDYLSSITFDFAWDMSSESESSYDRDNKIHDLVNAILMESEPQEEQKIFVLSDGVIAFCEAKLMDEEAAIGKVVGTWAVWEKLDEEYTLRMIFYYNK